MPQRDFDTSNPTSNPLTGVPIVVEVTPPNGDAKVLPWLGSRIQVSRPINGLPTATIGYVPDRGRLINVGTQSAAVYRTIQQEVPAFSRVTIRSALASPSDNIVLFSGYATRFRETAGDSGRGAAIECVHHLDDLDRGERLCVVGQAMRNVRFDNQADGAAFRPYIATARPTIFNPEGVPNCETRLVRVPLTVGEQFGVSEMLVPLFARPGDTSAQPWTWARVLAYLLWWSVHQPYVYQGHDGNPYANQDDPPQWIDANLTRLLMADDARLVRLDPRSNSGDASQPWRRALLAVPRSHALHGMPWLKAMKWTCAKSGVRFAIDDSAQLVGSGDDVHSAVRSRIRFSVPGGYQDGTIESEALRGNELRDAKLASPDYDYAARTQAEVLRRNDVHAYDVTEDHGQRVSSISVLGAPYVYECAVELVPAWAAHAAWDVNTSDSAAVTAAIAAMAPGQSTGDSFVLSKNAGLNTTPQLWSVGRRWALNTTGALTSLGRSYGPWNAAAYAVFDWSAAKWGELLRNEQYGFGVPTSTETADPGSTGQNTSAFAPQTHLAARRRILPLLSSVAFRAPMQPVVEVSFDSGATWRPLSGSPTLSQRDVSVTLMVDDLRGIVDPDDENENYATRYIRGQVRMRITLCVEGDQALYIPPRFSTPSGTTRPMEMLITRPADVALHVRGGEHGGAANGVQRWYGGNSGLNGSSNWPWTGRNAIEGEQRSIDDLTLRLDVSRYKATLDMVGLRIGREQAAGRFSDWMVGDECRGIIASDNAAYSHEFRAASWGGSLGEYPVVTAIEHTIDGGDGGGRAPQYATRVMLESPEVRTEFDIAHRQVWAKRGTLTERSE